MQNRKETYNLLIQWGDWVNAVDKLGYPNIAPYHVESSSGQTKKSDSHMVYRHPGNAVIKIDKTIKLLIPNDLALIRAHFKENMSYAKIGGLIDKSKSWVQQRINLIIKKLWFV